MSILAGLPLVAATVFAVVGQFLDARGTQKYVQAGEATEANPLDAFVIKHLGWTGLYVEKCLILPAAAGILCTHKVLGDISPWLRMLPSLIVGAGGLAAALYNRAAVNAFQKTNT